MNPPAIIQEMQETVVARQARESFLETRQASEANAIQEGLMLLKMRESNTHKALGFESWREFLAAPIESDGLAVNYRTAYRKMAVADVWVIEMGAQPERLILAGYSKLYVVREYVTVNNRDEVLDDAIHLSESDLIAKYTHKEPVVKEKRKVTCVQCGNEWELEE